METFQCFVHTASNAPTLCANLPFIFSVSRLSVSLSLCLAVSLSYLSLFVPENSGSSFLSFLMGEGRGRLKYSFTFLSNCQELCISGSYKMLISTINYINRLKEEIQISQLTHDGWRRRLGWSFD